MGDAYTDWNSVLGDRFFGKSQMRRLAYLAVDDDQLAALAPRVDASLAPEEAANAFASAVRAGLTARLPTNGIFARYVSQAQTWRDLGSHGSPPFIGLLGLCVLAASRMAADPEAGISGNDYYKRLGELLERDDGGIPPGFECVQELWKDLHRWLTTDKLGQRGISTVRRHERLSNVGYPMSQCLLAERDRNRLTYCFRSVGLEPHEDVSPEELYTLFKTWVHPDCGLSATALRLLDHATEEVHQQLQPIVCAEFDEWEGEFRDTRGRVRGEIVLQMTLSRGGREVSMRFIPRRPDGFPEGTFERQPGNHHTTLSAASDDWYLPLDLSVDSKSLARGVELEHSKRVLTFEPRQVIIFRPNFKTGGFASVLQAIPLEPHCILVNEAIAPKVMHFLGEVANPSWRAIDASAGLPADWRLLRDVSFIRPGVPDDPAMRCLAPKFATRLGLEGGLEVARSIYLSGEEPSVWISLEVDAIADIDGQELPLAAGGTTLDMRGFGLAAGPHELRVGGSSGQTCRFHTIEGFPVNSTSGTGQLGLLIRRHTTYRAESPGPVLLPNRDPSRGEVFISGGMISGHPDDLPVEAFPPVLLRTGFLRHVLLGAIAGQMLAVDIPREPEWLQRLGLPGQFFDQPCAFTPQWEVRYATDGPHLRPLVEYPSQAVEVIGISNRERLEWARAILAVQSDGLRLAPADSGVWTSYLETAAAIIDRDSRP